MNELDAVNLLLRKIGSGAVNSLTAGHPDIANARATLARTSRRLQKKGWWFNNEYNVTFQPNPITKEIQIPDTVSTLIITDTSVVRRGNKLFNNVTNSYQFDAPVTTHRLVRIVEWENLPESLQDAVAYTAAGEFVMDEIEDPHKKADLDAEAQRAIVMANKEDLESSQLNRFQNTRVAAARAGVRPYSSGSSSRSMLFGSPDA